MTLRLDILPPAQRAFWADHAAGVPRHFVLYGGTAVALRFGHRQSVDFDFFSSRALDEAALRHALPVLDASKLLHRDPNSLVVAMPLQTDELKLSFFGGLSFGRVGVPEATADRPAVAAPIDLLATKLKAIHDRIEAKDYLDIEVLLRSGLSLSDGIAAARALFGAAISPLVTAKAAAWFKDGGLETSLSPATRAYLENASAGVDLQHAMRPAALSSNELSLGG